MIHELDSTFHHRVRLGICSLLLKHGRLTFNELKDMLQVTDGNLASHLRVLEENGVVQFEKSFRGRRPVTHYELTAEGRRRFQEYLRHLRDLLGGLTL